MSDPIPSQVDQFMVLTRTWAGWEDCWCEDHEPLRFESSQEAEDAIDQHLADLAGTPLEGEYSRDDFKTEIVHQPEDNPSMQFVGNRL